MLPKASSSTMSGLIGGGGGTIYGVGINSRTNVQDAVVGVKHCHLLDPNMLYPKLYLHLTCCRVNT